MVPEDAAKTLSELGNTTRLAIFRYLIKVGPEGVQIFYDPPQYFGKKTEVHSSVP